MANSPKVAGQEARQKLGWFYSHRFLLLRRLTQFSILLLFLCGPLFGKWILEGNYSSSRFLYGNLITNSNPDDSLATGVASASDSHITLNVVPTFDSQFAQTTLNDVTATTSARITKNTREVDFIPMSDPLVVLQSISTGYWPDTTVLLGVVVIVLFYGLLAGKLFCSWVCPFNLVTDLAAWLRRKFNIPSKFNLHPSIRYFILVAVLVTSAVSGVIVWEWVNPVSVLGRGVINTAWEYGQQVSLGQALMIGFGASIWLLLAIFVLDLFVFKHGWCGHLCPMGALYSVIGTKGLIRIEASKRDACTKCMDCINICPEPQVLPKPLFAKQDSKQILSKECIRCGRCIDVCPEKVFSIKLKNDKRGE